MEVRPIKPEENIEFSKILNISFLFPRDYSGYKENPEEFQKGYENVRAVFDDAGKMCSGLILLPYRVYFDGSFVKMGGVAGVVTLPSERNKRYVRRLFEHIMEEMYDNEYVFSYLFPFSYAYYRKFGYELNMSLVECTIPFDALSHFKQQGKVELFLPQMDSSQIKSIYNQYIQGRNLALDMDSHWSRFHKEDPYASNTYLYTWYDYEGRAKGYLQYTIDRSDSSSSKPDMRLKEIIWLNGDAFRGMMAFLNSFASQFRNLIFQVPDFEDISPFFPDQRIIQQQIKPFGSNRVVNVRKALELMKTPVGAGKAVIEVQDPFFPRNTGRYLVEWENGKKMIRPGQNNEPDLICGVNHLSQLITGYKTVSRLKETGHVDAAGEPGVLDSLFPKKDLCIFDAF